MIDSQSVKASHTKTKGYDAGKKITGCKRHIAVDTDGRLLMVNLTTADISDGAYGRLQHMDKAAFLDFVIEIIKRSDDQKGFQGLPRR